MKELSPSPIAPAWAAFTPSWVVTVWPNQGRAPPVVTTRDVSRASAKGRKMVRVIVTVWVMPPPVAMTVTG